MDKTICELFAGVGGFRLGLEKSSSEWRTVWANQWEPGKKVQHAFECYCYHFGKTDNHINTDICLINKNEIPNHNLLVGGFPCQDYSVASTGAKGIEGKKGVLWWEIRNILEIKKPSFVLLENVDRLLKSPSKQRGKDFGIILGCFRDLGYCVEWRVINASDYGFAQKRRRVFIFAYLNTTNYYREQLNNINSTNLNGYLKEYGFFANHFPIDNIVIENRCVLDDKILDLSNKFNFEFFNSGVMWNNIIITQKYTPVIKKSLILGDMLEKNVDERFYLGNNLEKWIYLKGAKAKPRKSKEGFEYIYREGAVAFPDAIDKPARTMLTSESSVNRSTHVIKDPITNRLRLLTPVECERLNGFDDNWTDTGMPEKFRYFCMGNALVVGLIELMGQTLSRIIELEPSTYN